MFSGRIFVVLFFSCCSCSNSSSLSSRIYITENGTLKGYITMAVLLTHQPDTPVADLLREMEEMLREVNHNHRIYSECRIRYMRSSSFEYNQM